jgi:excisionase family DNA binding protein
MASKTERRKEQQPEQPRPAALTMDDVAAALRCSVPTVYRLVSDGHLKTFLIGRKRYASPRALEACVEGLEKLGSVLPAQSGGNNRTGPGKGNEAPRDQEA